MDFQTAFNRLLINEGAYLSAADAARQGDPGGETKYGISKRAYPGEDIANLTLDRAREIYKRDYWGPAGCDAWPDAIKFQAFDTAVNMGPRTAIRLLQAAVGAHQDGVIGPQTLMLVQAAQPEWLLRQLLAKAIRNYTGLKSFSTFGAGWMNRIAANLERM